MYKIEIENCPKEEVLRGAEYVHIFFSLSSFNVKFTHRKENLFSGQLFNLMRKLKLLFVMLSEGTYYLRRSRYKYFP